MNINIRRVYLYITSFIGLIVIIIGTVQLINLGLKTWVFTKADELYFGPCPVERFAPDSKVPAPTSTPEEVERCEKERAEQKTARRQTDGARSIAMILVGTPVYLYHWRKIKNDKDAI